MWLFPFESCAHSALRARRGTQGWHGKSAGYIYLAQYIYIPVVPARGEAEDALKIYNIDPGEPAAEVSEK